MHHAIQKAKAPSINTEPAQKANIYMGSAFGCTASLVNYSSKRMLLPPAVFQTSPVIMPLLLIFYCSSKTKEVLC
jgi:hypothetical protein